MAKMNSNAILKAIGEHIEANGSADAVSSTAGNALPLIDSNRPLFVQMFSNRLQMLQSADGGIPSKIQFSLTILNSGTIPFLHIIRTGSLIQILPQDGNIVHRRPANVVNILVLSSTDTRIQKMNFASNTRETGLRDTTMVREKGFATFLPRAKR